MKNPDWEPAYKAELIRLGWPRARALEILANTGTTKRSRKEAEMWNSRRRFIEREAQAAAQKRLAHKEPV